MREGGPVVRERINRSPRCKKFPFSLLSLSHTHTTSQPVESAAKWRLPLSFVRSLTFNKEIEDLATFFLSNKYQPRTQEEGRRGLKKCAASSQKVMEMRSEFVSFLLITSSRKRQAKRGGQARVQMYKDRSPRPTQHTRVIDLLLQLYLALYYPERWNRVARAENQIKTKHQNGNREKERESPGRHNISPHE